MDFQATRQLVLEFVRHIYNVEDGNIQLQAVLNQLKRYVQENNNNWEQIFNKINGEDVLDIINSLMQEGILRWGLDSNNPGPPFIGLTSYGKKVLESNEPIPYDPDGYLDMLHKKIPKLDPVTEMYLVESLQTFLRNNFMASAVMLGVSSESIFNILYDELTNSIQSEKIKKKLENLRDSAKTKQRINLVRDILLITYKETIPKELTDDFESKTDPLFNLMREIRNDVGHPTGIKVSRMTMFVNLQLFIPYCETSYKWIEFLKTTKL